MCGENSALTATWTCWQISYAHAPGEIVVDLNGEYELFEAEVGVQWQGGNVGSVVFQVYLEYFVHRYNLAGYLTTGLPAPPPSRRQAHPASRGERTAPQRFDKRLRKASGGGGKDRRSRLLLK